jgi:CheY-like chemotaxis protein
MTREYGGLGVGLAICRQLIELIGGRLTHQSEPGRGSRFQLDVEFDVRNVPPPSAEQTLKGYTPISRRVPQECTVLLVDDNGINQLVVRGMLLKLGYRVRTADSGRLTLELLRRESFDAVLLDCQLPQLDGVSICCQVRALPGCAELPILAVTQGAERERCQAARMTDYLSKPVKFEELQAVLYRRVLCPKQGESADI